MAASALWASQDIQLWRAWHAHHSEAVAAKQGGGAHSKTSTKNRNGLVNLQRFIDVELPAAVASRTPPHITKAELVRLVEWKLARDKWRPQLLKFAEQQEEGQVAAASTRALAVLQGACWGPPVPQETFDDLGKAIKEFTQLKGVGPATASALFSALCPEGAAAYMSPEGLAATGGKADTYTLPAYLAMLRAMHGKAEVLRRAAEQAGLPEADGRDLCSARGVERCLQAAQQFQGVLPAPGPQAPLAAPAETAADAEDGDDDEDSDEKMDSDNKVKGAKPGQKRKATSVGSASQAEKSGQSQPKKAGTKTKS